MSQLDFYIFPNKFRNAFWPIKKAELPKFIPMAALMFCVLFNQNILRILKDSILISEISAEVTSFAKVYFVTPAAAVFVVIYAKMINHMPFSRIFYYLVGFFTGFYAIFAFILYPNIDYFHMDQDRLEYLMQAHPHFQWYIALFGNWSYIIFYSLSELWPNVFYILLFWQLANEITSTGEAKRFYTLFSLFGNSSVVVVGILMLYLSSEEGVMRQLFTISESKIILTQVSTVFIALSGIIACLLVRHITKRVMTNPNLYLKPKDELAKGKMGIIESFKYISRSKYLWLLLICSAAFGLSMNLVEAVWKAKIKELYPTVTEFAAFSSTYVLWTGVVIMVLTVVGSNIMRTKSWFTAAVISPVIILITGTMFFVLVVFDEEIISYYEGAILSSPLALAVSVGAIQNILSKGSKYSIWDTSREMLYIPLDNELKTKGKAAVDVISPKIGKSASGLVQSLIFTIFPLATYNSIASGLMWIFIIVCLMWIYAIRKIYFEYEKLI